MRILIVEDDLEAAEVMDRGLTEAGHECVRASDGEAGLSAAQAGEFDVIFPHETAAIARAVPNARLVIAPDCGHSLPKQAPDLVCREVLRQLHAA